MPSGSGDNSFLHPLSQALPPPGLTQEHYTKCLSEADQRQSTYDNQTKQGEEDYKNRHGVAGYYTTNDTFIDKELRQKPLNGVTRI